MHNAVQAWGEHIATSFVSLSVLTYLLIGGVMAATAVVRRLGMYPYSLVAFPGTVAHELAHYVLAKLFFIAACRNVVHGGCDAGSGRDVVLDPRLGCGHDVSRLPALPGRLEACSASAPPCACGGRDSVVGDTRRSRSRPCQREGVVAAEVLTASVISSRLPPVRAAWTEKQRGISSASF